jgi:sugar-specific transcriptional regulator TrmB/DNA-binding CsgD family transcriptional regulator
MSPSNRTDPALSTTSNRSRSNAERPFEILGIAELEERVYRWLLAHPRSALRDVAQALTLSLRTTQRLLDAIEAKGLTTHTPERPCRYLPAAPDMALQALILQRQKDLQDARVAALDLQEQAAALRHGEQEQVVELINSREAEAQVFEHMHRTAQHEVMTLIRLPGRVSRLDVANDEAGRTQREAAARGVRFRSIVDAEFLAATGAVERIRTDMKTGEDVRVFSSLPFKLLVADRRIALIPLNLHQPGSPVLLVRSSTLLDALCVLFDILWERAAPIRLDRIGAFDANDPMPAWLKEVEDLLPLLAAGMNDKAIAHQLGVSLRTLNRRIGDLSKGLDARSRFQAGWLAALRLSAKSLTPPKPL